MAIRQMIVLHDEHQPEKVKGKVKSSLSTKLRHIGGAEVQLHPFFTPTLDGGEWLVTRTVRFAPGERTPVPI